MSNEDTIKDVEVEVEIWRGVRDCLKTKAKHNIKDNTFDFEFDIDIRVEDHIRVIDTGKSYMVADVINGRKKNHTVVKVV